MKSGNALIYFLMVIMANGISHGGIRMTTTVTESRKMVARL